jgi:hypothetical protein
MKAEVASATLKAPNADAIALIAGDIKAVGRIHELTIAAGAEVEMIDVVLADIEQ